MSQSPNMCLCVLSRFFFLLKSSIWGCWTLCRVALTLSFWATVNPDIFNTGKFNIFGSYFPPKLSHQRFFLSRAAHQFWFTKCWLVLRRTHIFVRSVWPPFLILEVLLMCRSSISSETLHRHRNGGMRGEKWVGREGGGGGGELRHRGEERRRLESGCALGWDAVPPRSKQQH